MSRSVSIVEAAKRIFELLGLEQGEPFEIAKTRDGRVIVARVEGNQT